MFGLESDLNFEQLNGLTWPGAVALMVLILGPLAALVIIVWLGTRD